jgi:hypothetical protein
MTQHATAVAAVQLLVQQAGLSAFEGATNSDRDVPVSGNESVRVRTLPLRFQSVRFVPALSLVVPLGEHVERDRIVLPDRYEVRGPRLSPMRQISDVNPDLAVRIERPKDGFVSVAWLRRATPAAWLSRAERLFCS